MAMIHTDMLVGDWKNSVFYLPSFVEDSNQIPVAVARGELPTIQVVLLVNEQTNVVSPIPLALLFP